MTIRTTAPNVKDILGDHYDGSTNLAPFIATASSIVNKLGTADTGGVHGVDDLELIERWLAAWAYEASDKMYQSKNTGRASASFQGQTGMIFNSNYYGQTALALDTTGYLMRLQQQSQNGPRVAGAAWLGTRYRDDWSERNTDQ